SKKSCGGANSGTYPRANGRSLAAFGHRSAYCTDTGANSHGFNLALLVHSFALDFAFFVGLLGGMFSRNAGDCGDQGNPSVTGVNLIEAEQHTRVQSLLDRTDVSLHFLPALDHRAVRCHQVFSELGFEVLSLLQLRSVEFVVE